MMEVILVLLIVFGFVFFLLSFIGGLVCFDHEDDSDLQMNMYRFNPIMKLGWYTASLLGKIFSRLGKWMSAKPNQARKEDDWERNARILKENAKLKNEIARLNEELVELHLVGSKND